MRILQSAVFRRLCAASWLATALTTVPTNGPCAPNGRLDHMLWPNCPRPITDAGDGASESPAGRIRTLHRNVSGMSPPIRAALSEWDRIRRNHVHRPGDFGPVRGSRAPTRQVGSGVQRRLGGPGVRAATATNVRRRGRSCGGRRRDTGPGHVPPRLVTDVERLYVTRQGELIGSFRPTERRPGDACTGIGLGPTGCSGGDARTTLRPAPRSAAGLELRASGPRLVQAFHLRPCITASDRRSHAPFR